MYRNMIGILLLNYCATIGQYTMTRYLDERMSIVYLPFKKIHPVGIWKFFVPYKDKNRSVVNFLFGAQIFSLVLALIYDIGLLILYLNDLFWGTQLIIYDLVFFLFYAIGGVGIPKWCTIINNGPLRRKYEKANPIQARKHHIQSSQTSKDSCIRVNGKLEKRALDLEKALRKYCYTKEKGITYILVKDLDRIRIVELKKYKYACEKTEYDEKGQQYFVVYDEYHQREIFRAPIK